MAGVFDGRWIGETQGYDMPAHIWEIKQNGAFLNIISRWEDESEAGRLQGRLQPDGTSFAIGDMLAEQIDSQHFIIPGWDTNDTRGGIGPAYDVVFSRPGLAELTAKQAWQRYQNAKQTE